MGEKNNKLIWALRISAIISAIPWKQVFLLHSLVEQI